MSQSTVRAPFTFEILLVMRNIVFPLVRDFRPDLIVYIESYPSDMRVMEEDVRGLMLSEMAE